MSESEAAGKLTKIPGIVDAAATTPVQSVGVPRLSEKGLRTGLFDIVELRIAKKPIMQSVRNTLFLALFPCRFIGKPAWIISRLSNY